MQHSLICIHFNKQLRCLHIRLCCVQDKSVNKPKDRRVGGIMLKDMTSEILQPHEPNYYYAGDNISGELFSYQKK